MKLSDYKEKLKADREYQKAYEALKYQFLFGNEVLRARLGKGWTQTELARRVGTKQANISRIEGGLGNPTLELIQKICKALDLQLNFNNQVKVNREPEFITTASSSAEDFSAGNPIPAPDWPVNIKLGYPNTSTATSMITEVKAK